MHALGLRVHIVVVLYILPTFADPRSLIFVLQPILLLLRFRFVEVGLDLAPDNDLLLAFGNSGLWRLPRASVALLHLFRRPLAVRIDVVRFPLTELFLGWPSGVFLGFSKGQWSGWNDTCSLGKG